MISKSLSSLLLILMTSLPAASAVTDVVRVLIGTTGESPYSETAPGGTLATMNAAVLGQLFQTDATFDLKAGLIGEWRWDFERKVYVLKLKPGIRFHNGRAVTAADLEFSLVRGFFTQHRTFYKIYLGNIDGVAEAEKLDHYTPGAVRGVRVVAPDTVEVALSRPNPSFLHSLVNPYFSLVPIEEMKSDLVNWKTVPIGAGPYRVIEGFKDGKVVIEKTAGAPSRAPARVEFYTDPGAAIHFDIACENFPGPQPKGLTAEKTKFPASVTTLFFSNLNPLSKNLSFRRAVGYAVDRKALAEGLADFVPTYEMLPSQFWGRAGLPDPYDPARAKGLLSKLSRTELEKEWPIPVFSGPKFSPQYELILKKLKAQLADVGIKVRFEPDQEKFTSEKTAIASPIFMSGQVSDYVDPLVMFASFRPKSAFSYESAQPGEDFETLYAEAAASPEKAERVKTIRALSQYLNDQAIAVPMLERHMIRRYDPRVVESLGDQSQPLTLFIDRVVLTKTQ